MMTIDSAEIRLVRMPLLYPFTISRHTIPRHAMLDHYLPRGYCLTDFDAQSKQYLLERRETQ